MKSSKTKQSTAATTSVRKLDYLARKRNFEPRSYEYLWKEIYLRRKGLWVVTRAGKREKKKRIGQKIVAVYSSEWKNAEGSFRQTETTAWGKLLWGK